MNDSSHKNKRVHFAVFRPFVVMIFAVLLSCWQTVGAYSAIWKADGYDSKKLKEIGITITSWKHEQIGEEPAMQWVELAYDWSKLAEDQNVSMTLNLVGKDGETVAASRVEHAKGDPGKLKLIFAVPAAQPGDSYVMLLFPDLLAKASERVFGDPGLGGYTLQVSRILQLANEKAAEKPESNDKAPESKSEKLERGEADLEPMEK